MNAGYSFLSKMLQLLEAPSLKYWIKCLKQNFSQHGLEAKELLSISSNNCMLCFKDTICNQNSKSSEKFMLY